MSETQLREALAERFGVEKLAPKDRLREYAVDGRLPGAVCLPQSVEDVSGILAWANDRGYAVFPRGGGTQVGLGGLTPRVDIVLSLERLNRLIAFEPADMTVTVEAGMTLADLQVELAKGNQFLPVDPPLPRPSTVGGVLATRASGPLRLMFRLPSDRLLGVKVVGADGTVTKAGGRVVKNVSGYEMGRLYTGSLGTLAVIVEATFKVQPRCERHDALLIPVGDLGEVETLAELIRDSRTVPAFVELLGPFDGPDRLTGESADFGAQLASLLFEGIAAQAGSHRNPRGGLLVVGFCGTKAEVDWQLNEVDRVVGAESTRSAGTTARRSWEAVYPAMLACHRCDAAASMLHGLQGSRSVPRAEFPKGAVSLRVHVRPSDLVGYLRFAGDALGSSGIPHHFAAHAGAGVVRLQLRAAAGDIRRLVEPAEALRETAESQKGFLVVESAPPAFKEAFDVWGSPGEDFFLHRAIKEKLDPKGTLNPRRFIGAI